MGNTDYIYKNDLDKTCFRHDMAYGKYKDLDKKAESDKLMKDETFKIASNPNYDGYQRGLASMVYKFFNEKSAGSGAATLANKTMSNQLQLANELHKPIIRTFKRRRAYSSFKDKIWGVDLTDMQLIIKYNKEIRCLFCSTDLSSKYVCVLSLKEEKGITIANSFLSILDSSKRRSNKIWVDQSSEFYSSPFKKWLKENHI